MVGVLLEAKGDIEGARDRFERVLQIDPEAAVAANNLAWIYAQHGGNLDVAMHLAQTAQKRMPEVAEVGDTLGFIYYKKNLAVAGDFDAEGERGEGSEQRGVPLSPGPGVRQFRGCGASQGIADAGPGIEVGFRWS